MIHGSTQQYITQIARQSSRVLKVTLGHLRSRIPIHIISTYAPHNGHAEEDRRQHWEEVQEILNKTCRRHMIIWRTDANGQLVRNKEEGQKGNTENDARNKIGPYKSKSNRKRKLRAPFRNMPKTPNDTDGNMEGAEQGKTRHMENTDTAKIRPRKDGKRKWKTNT